MVFSSLEAQWRKKLTAQEGLMIVEETQTQGWGHKDLGWQREGLLLLTNTSMSRCSSVTSKSSSLAAKVITDDPMGDLVPLMAQTQTLRSEISGDKFNDKAESPTNRK